MVIDFWRPTNMAGPLMHMPLALCDASSVEITDLVPTAMTGIAPSGLPTHHVALRYSPRHRWYYYPRMGTDEVLAFKLFECRKDDPEPARFRSVLHTAFADPIRRPGPKNGKAVSTASELPSSATSAPSTSLDTDNAALTPPRHKSA